MDTEIQRANARWRRVTAIVLSVAVVLALIVVYTVHRWLAGMAAELPPELLIARLRAWSGVAVTGCALCFVILAGYAAWVARLTQEQRRWPPSSFRVIRDTPIRRDAAAVRISRRLRASATTLLVLAVIVAWLGWRVFSGAH